VGKKTGGAICGGNNFVFNAFLYLQPVRRYENMVRTGGLGRLEGAKSKNRTSKRMLDVLKAI